MSEETTQSWTERAGKKPPRPRVLFSEHMVVFAADGVRSGLSPEHKWPDGFHNPAEAIYLAGPDELKPENHSRLRDTLAKKLAEAKALPFSDIELSKYKSRFPEMVLIRAIEAFPQAVIKHFAPHSEFIREHFNTPEAMERVARDDYNSYLLLDNIRPLFKSDDASLYKHLKKLLKEQGKDFHALEVDAAQAQMAYMLQELHLSPDELNRLSRALVVTAEKDGEMSVRLSRSGLKALHLRLIEESYHDIDAAIAKGREIMKEKAFYHGAKDPFELTAEEKRKVQEIDSLVQREIAAKPVVLAGYHNPNLSILINHELGDYSAGISYEGQEFIRVAEHSHSSPFYSTLVEELLHQGLERIYDNESFPYRKGGDNRKAVMERAIAADGGAEQVYAHLGLFPFMNYNPKNERSMHREVPVKMMKVLDAEEIFGGQTQTMSVQESRGFRHLRDFVEKVVIPDAQDYLKNRKLPDIGDDLSRRPPIPPRSGGWKIE